MGYSRPLAKMTEAQLIVAAVVRWYPLHLFAVCNRVSHGLGLNYEADAIAIGNSGLCDEIEAKSTLSDLRADLGKRKWKMIETGNRQHFADRFWYVVPERLNEAAIAQAKPRGFGVVAVNTPDEYTPYGDARRTLRAKRLHKRSGEREAEMISKIPELWRLNAFRHWDLLMRQVKAENKKHTTRGPFDK